MLQPIGQCLLIVNSQMNILFMESLNWSICAILVKRSNQNPILVVTEPDKLTGLWLLLIACCPYLENYTHIGIWVWVWVLVQVLFTGLGNIFHLFLLLHMGAISNGSVDSVKQWLVLIIIPFMDLHLNMLISSSMKSPSIWKHSLVHQEYQILQKWTLLATNKWKS